MIAHTSLEAYDDLRASGDLPPMEARVMRVFETAAAGTSYSRQQISQISGMPINCVCGRVNTLVANGVLEEHGTRIDPATRKPQKLVRMAWGH